MTKMVRKTRGWGVNFWASENWSGRVHFEGHSPEWRVLSKLSVQPWDSVIQPLNNPGLVVKSIFKLIQEQPEFSLLQFSNCAVRFSVYYFLSSIFD